jgi:hypothetical protein
MRAERHLTSMLPWLLAAILMLPGCVHSPGPSDVVKRWASILEEGKLDDSVELYSSRLVHQETIGGARVLSETFSKVYFNCANKGFEVQNESIVRDSAEVVVRWKCGGRSRVTLIREREGWRIDNIFFLTN